MHDSTYFPPKTQKINYLLNYYTLFGVKMFHKYLPIKKKYVQLALGREMFP